MKLQLSYIASTFVLAVSLSFVGCSGGGGDSGATTQAGGTTPPVSSAVSTATVSGSVGSSNKSVSGSSTVANTTSAVDILATLIVDGNGNGKFDDPSDIKLSTRVVDGTFTFENVEVDENGTTEALLSVTRDGFAPYVQTLSLTKDNVVSILADVQKKPLYQEVIQLPKSDEARATSFMVFGMKDGGGGIESFSKLMSLSEFKAMADTNVSLEDSGEITKSVIPVAAFPKGVKTVTASMQSFNSSDPEDFEFFPGKLSGHGKPGLTASATNGNDEVDLESAGFDLLKLTDQNGKLINLEPVGSVSKLSAQAGTEVCGGMLWTRRLHSSEVGIIAGWGDDDNTTAGYQVPIWSNDNATGSWEWVGEATVYNSDNSLVMDDMNNTAGKSFYFKTCVDRKWQGYLNCDSPLATSKPKQMCITSHDQNGNPLGGVILYAQNGGMYAYATTASNSYGSHVVGKGIMTFPSGKAKTLTEAQKFTYKYRSPLTGWSFVELDQSSITTDTNSSNSCDYKLDISLIDPYTSNLHVKAYAMDDVNKTKPLASKRVRVYNTDNDIKHWYNQYLYTDANGTAIFKVEPGVSYTITYEAGKSTALANGVIDNNETADTTREVYVDVQDKNVKPRISAYIDSYHLTDAAESANFYVTARDDNRDPLTLKYIKLNGTPLVKDRDYTVSYEYSRNGYYSLQGKLNLNSATISAIKPFSLQAGNYTLSADVSDGILNSSDSDNFEVYVNQAPIIYSFNLRSESTGRYYYAGSNNIPEGNFTFHVYTYDPDGDEYNTTMKFDGSTVTGSEHVSKGDHNITVETVDEHGNKNKSTFTFYAGNHAPVISWFTANDYFISKGDSLRLYVYASDADRDNNITVSGTDDNNNSYSFTKYYGRYYCDVNVSQAFATDNNVTFRVSASDGEDTSTPLSLTVKKNRPPVFTANTDLNNTSMLIIPNQFETMRKTFTCEANDPDGTTVRYKWYRDGILTSYYTYSTIHTETFSQEGNYTISCEAFDRDGASIVKEANISVAVNNPPIFDSTMPESLKIYQGIQDFNCTAHDPEGRGTVTYKWKIGDSYVEGATSALFSHNFTTLGNYNVMCEASDIDGLTNTQKTSVTVMDHYEPVIDIRLEKSVALDVNQSHTFTCMAHDPEKGTLTYNWFVDNTAHVSDTNESQLTLSFPTAGNHNVTCNVSNGFKTVSSSSVVTVTKPNTPPTVDYEVSKTVDANTTLHGTINFSDSDGTATIAVSGTVPAGFVINHTTGEYSYDPSVAYGDLPEGQSADVYISLVVTDNLGATANTYINITVRGTKEIVVDTNATGNDSPLVGAWNLSEKDDQNNTYPFGALVVILDNQHYFMTQQVLGDNGILGGIEAGVYDISTDKNVFSNAQPVVNTNAEDSAVDGSFTYNAANGTATFRDAESAATFTSLRSTYEHPEAGAWIMVTGENTFTLFAADGSTYMITDVNLSDNSTTNNVNKTEFGTYTFTNGLFSPTPAKDTTNPTQNDVIAGDSNGNRGLNSLSSMQVNFENNNDVMYVDIGGGSELKFIRIRPNGLDSGLFTKYTLDSNGLALKNLVNGMATPSNVADVDNAKYMVKQLREASSTFIDLTNDLNSSTIVGQQQALLVKNIEPSLMKMSSDLNASVTALQAALNNFNIDLNNDLGPVLIPIQARLEAIVELFKAHDTNTSWDDTTKLGDAIAHKYAKEGTTVTETYTLNGQKMTLSWEDTDNGGVNSASIDGTVEMSTDDATKDAGYAYRVTIKSLAFDGSKADFNATASLDGNNSATMRLNELSLSFDANKSLLDDGFGFFGNIRTTLDGEISVNDRKLVGKITLNETDNTKNRIVGIFTGQKGEPNFEGSIAMNTSLTGVKNVLSDDDKAMEDNWGAANTLLMVKFADKTMSFVTMRVQEDSSYEDGVSTSQYTLVTQADKNVTCNMQDSNIENSFTHTVTCNNAEVIPYYGYNKVITATVNGKEYVVGGAWSDWQKIGDKYAQTAHLYLKDKGDVKVKDVSSAKLVFANSGNEAVISNLAMRDAATFDEMMFNVKVTGTLTQGATIVQASIGLANMISEKNSMIYVKNVVLQNSVNKIEANEISLGTSTFNMKYTLLSQLDPYSEEFWRMQEGQMIHSMFENYTVTYNNNMYMRMDKTPYKLVQTLKVIGLKAALTGVDSKVLTLDANLSLQRVGAENIETINFSGMYDYQDTKFTGMIGANGLVDMVAGSVYVDGKVEPSDGFEPFGIKASILRQLYGQIEGYLLFTRGTAPYNLGVSLVSNYNDSARVFKIVDSNGVMGTYSENDTINSDVSISFTDKNGKELATYGKDKTGNNWEVHYSDNTSETLY